MSRNPALFALSLALLAGCGSSNGNSSSPGSTEPKYRQLDVAKLEDRIKLQIENQAGIKVQRVTCPKSEDARQGNTFSCSARSSGGQTIPVRVTVTTNAGDVTFHAGS